MRTLLTIRRTLLLASALLLGTMITTTAMAQTAYHLGKPSVMTLYGTSTLHDFTMTAHAFTIDGRFEISADNTMTGVSGLSLTLPVTNLKGEKDGLNDNAYESLKADEFKNITFRLTSARVNATGPHKNTITAVGNLTIAGVTRSVTMNVNAQVNGDGSIGCTGTVPLKLSEFGIERPSFMLGTMKVGDAMTLTFSLLLVK